MLDRSGFCRRWPHLCSELDDSFRLFEDGERNDAKQAFHTEKVVGLLEEEMKDCLVGLAQYLFGKGNLLHCQKFSEFSFLQIENSGQTKRFFGRKAKTENDPPQKAEIWAETQFWPKD